MGNFCILPQLVEFRRQTNEVYGRTMQFRIASIQGLPNTKSTVLEAYEPCPFSAEAFPIRCKISFACCLPTQQQVPKREELSDRFLSRRVCEDMVWLPSCLELYDTSFYASAMTILDVQYSKSCIPVGTCIEDQLISSCILTEKGNAINILGHICTSDDCFV